MSVSDYLNSLPQGLSILVDDVAKQLGENVEDVAKCIRKLGQVNDLIEGVDYRYFAPERKSVSADVPVCQIYLSKFGLELLCRRYISPTNNDKVIQFRTLFLIQERNRRDDFARLNRECIEMQREIEDMRRRIYDFEHEELPEKADAAAQVVIQEGQPQEAAVAVSIDDEIRRLEAQTNLETALERKLQIEFEMMKWKKANRM